MDVKYKSWEGAGLAVNKGVVLCMALKFIWAVLSQPLADTLEEIKGSHHPGPLQEKR